MPSPSPLDRATPAAPLPEPHLRARPAAPVRPEPAFGTCALAATAVALLAAVVFVPRMGGAFVADSYQIVGLLDVLLREGNLWSEVLASDAYRVTLQP
ncbi:MAG TPA: hypothetical protein VK081_01365, partial [Planctomycetota bacterium]|nr:hypothetical protein [Planctomycetota bacterium]